MKISFKIDTFQAVTQMLEEYKISKFSSFNEFLDNMYPHSTIIPPSRFGNAVVLLSNEEYKHKSLSDSLRDYGKDTTPVEVVPIISTSPIPSIPKIYKRWVMKSLPVISENTIPVAKMHIHPPMECNQHEINTDYHHDGIDCTHIA